MVYFPKFASSKEFMDNRYNSERSPLANQHDEVDIGIIFRKIQRGFTRTGNFFSRLGLVIKRRLLLLLLFMSVGMGVGLIWYFKAKPYFIASMTVIPNEVRNDFAKELIDKLNIPLSEGSYRQAAKNLGVSEQLATQLGGIEYSLISENRFHPDSIVVGQPFEITLTVFEPAVFDTMETVLVKFLEGNNYLLQRKKVREEQLENLANKLEIDIRQLDSLKREVASPRGPSNGTGFVFGEPIDPVRVYREGIRIYRQQQKINQQLTFIDNFQVLSGFAARDQPDGPRKSTYLLHGAWIAFLVGLVVAVTLEDRKKAPKELVHQEA